MCESKEIIKTQTRVEIVNELLKKISELPVDRPLYELDKNYYWVGTNIWAANLLAQDRSRVLDALREELE
jgi:hypothetical protein